MGEQERLEGIINFRDVGAAIGSGAGLEPGRLYRCASIDKATRHDRQFLQHELGISTIIKLKGPPPRFVVDPKDPLLYKPAYENGVNSYQVLDISVHEIAVESKAYKDTISKKFTWVEKTKVGMYAITGDLQKYRKLLFRTAWKDRSVHEVICKVLASSKPQIRAVFEALAAEDACPVLLCEPGEDFVVCLILKFLDVADENIIRDNQLSEHWKGALKEERREYLRSIGIDPDEEPSRDCSVTEYVEGIIEHLETQCKGIEAYLESIGLTPAQLQQIRNNLQGTASRSEKLVDF